MIVILFFQIFKNNEDIMKEFYQLKRKSYNFCQFSRRLEKIQS